MGYRIFKTLGFGAGSAAIFLSVFPQTVRPALKLIIKGGLTLKQQIDLIYEENIERLDDIVAEAKEEMI